MLFDDQPGQVPAPVTSTSYAVAGAGPVSHTLLGVRPGGRYTAVLAGGVMHVDLDPAGSCVASPAGVLRF